VSAVELALVSADGDRHEVRVDLAPRIGLDGEVIGAIAVGHDITDICHFAAEQKNEAEDMARLIRCANAPIIGVDINCHLMEWNDKMASMTGYTKEEVLGRPLIDDFIVKESKPKVLNMVEQAKLGVEAMEFDFEVMTKDVGRVTLTMSGSAFRDTTGSIAGVVACGQDLTKMREIVLEKTRVAEDLTRLIDTANAPILGIDTDGIVTEWNCKVAEISGWAKEEALGKPLLETFISESYWEDVGRILEGALNGHESANYEFPLFTKDGRRREILLNATTRRSACGEVTGVIGVGQDITEMRTAMAEQQRIADGLARFIQTANAPIFGVDVTGRVTEWNRKAEEVSGFTKEEALGQMLIDEFIAEENRYQVHCALERAWQGDESANFEMMLVSKDGSKVEILLNATPTRLSDGKVTGWAGVGQDITVLREAMQRSEQVAADWTRMIDTTNAPIFCIEASGLITEWNQKAAEISGWGKEEAMGKSLVDNFIKEDCREEVSLILKQALEGHGAVNYDFPLCTKDGQRREILLNTTTRRSADGVVRGVMGVGQDITELRALMQQSQTVADDLSRIMDTANAPIFGVDTEGRVTVWNRKAAKITGFSYDEAAGRRFVGDFIQTTQQELVHGHAGHSSQGEGRERFRACFVF